MNFIETTSIIGTLFIGYVVGRVVEVLINKFNEKKEKR